MTGFSPNAIAALSLAGILHFVWGRYCNYRAMRAIGTNLAAPVQQVNLIFTLAVAIWILGETLTPLRVLGIALILLGPGLTMREGNGQSGETAPDAAAAERIAVVESAAPATERLAAFKPRYAEGYAFALLSATGYGLSPIFIRLGLEDRGLGASMAGGLISYLAATAVMALVLLWPGQLRQAMAVKPEAAKWFTFSGCHGLRLADVLLHGAGDRAGHRGVADQPAHHRVPALFQPHAQSAARGVRRQVILGTVVSLVGAVILSLSTDMVTSLLPLPDAVVSVLKWHWP